MAGVEKTKERGQKKKTGENGEKEADKQTLYFNMPENLSVYPYPGPGKYPDDQSDKLYNIFAELETAFLSMKKDHTAKNDFAHYSLKIGNGLDKISRLIDVEEPDCLSVFIRDAINKTLDTMQKAKVTSLVMDTDVFDIEELSVKTRLLSKIAKNPTADDTVQLARKLNAMKKGGEGDKKKFENLLQPSNTSKTLNDVFGQDELVETLQRKALSESLGEVERVSNSVRGIILFGPPGTGKTMLVDAYANSTKRVLYKVKGSDLLRGVLGDSEGILEGIFNQASSNKSIVFVDEFESLFASRESSSVTEYQKSLLGIMLQILDGGESSKKYENVLFIGATNRLDDIDSAILSRTLQFEVGLLNEEKMAILLEKTISKLSPTNNLDLKTIAHQMHEYEMSNRSILLAVDEAIENTRNFVLGAKKYVAVPDTLHYANLKRGVFLLNADASPDSAIVVPLGGPPIENKYYFFPSEDDKMGYKYFGRAPVSDNDFLFALRSFKDEKEKRDRKAREMKN